MERRFLRPINTNISDIYECDFPTSFFSAEDVSVPSSPEAHQPSISPDNHNSSTLRLERNHILHSIRCVKRSSESTEDVEAFEADIPPGKVDVAVQVKEIIFPRKRAKTYKLQLVACGALLMLVLIVGMTFILGIFVRWM